MRDVRHLETGEADLDRLLGLVTWQALEPKQRNVARPLERGAQDVVRVGREKNQQVLVGELLREEDVEKRALQARVHVGLGLFDEEGVAILGHEQRKGEDDQLLQAVAEVLELAFFAVDLDRDRGSLASLGVARNEGHVGAREELSAQPRLEGVEPYAVLALPSDGLVELVVKSSARHDGVGMVRRDRVAIVQGGLESVGIPEDGKRGAKRREVLHPNRLLSSSRRWLLMEHAQVVPTCALEDLPPSVG
jgi:hypothetical protein